jgi:hypothetical protein
MSKQTAAEWLFKKLWDEPKDKLTWYAILEQAKEMEEQQTIDAYVIGAKNQIYGVDLSGLEYYNKTFNK